MWEAGVSVRPSSSLCFSLRSEKEILQGELKALEHIRDAQKQKIHEMEEEMKKVREELEKMKAAKSDDEVTVRRVSAQRVSA